MYVACNIYNIFLIDYRIKSYYAVKSTTEHRRLDEHVKSYVLI